MTSRAGVLVLRWLLLCAIALGVLVMHHADPAPGHHAMSNAAMTVAEGTHAGHGHEPDPLSGFADLVHLCLAVLSAAALYLVLRQFGVSRHGMACPPRSTVVVRGHARPPPLSWGRHTLHRLCVLRV